MRTSRWLAVLGVSVLFACGGDRDGRSEPERWDAELPISAPWLRAQLPDGIRAYYRMPHPLGLLAMPKGNALDRALASAENMGAFVTVAQGLYANVLAQIPGIEDTGLRALIESLRSPIEIAAFGLPNPSALIAATLALDSHEEFERLFAALAQLDPPLALAAGLDDAGVGRITGLPTDAYVKFDAASGRVVIQALGAVSETGFASLIERLVARDDHPMLALEREIDASGQGLFAWVDLAALLPAAGLFMPPDVAEVIASVGLGAAQSLALGIGVADGKGRLSVLLDVGGNDSARPFPVVANSVAATTVGAPDGVVLLSLPSAAEFSRLEALALDALPAEQQQGWVDIETMLRESLGTGIEDVLGAIGPELVFVFDAAGDYAAVRLRDPVRFDALIASVGEQIGATLEQRAIAGETFFHWRLPSLDAMMLAGAAEPNGAIAILTRIRDHWHWTRDGDFLYVASVPQPLIDRARVGARTPLGEWLASTQRIDVASAVFAATAPIDKVPRRLYHLYLQTMQLLADLAAVDYDIWSMPTASELDLPAQSAVGFSVNLGEPYVSVELTFESSPLELFFGSTMSGAAVVGVLAAIAIPAYQDYTARARANVGLAAARGTQAAVAEFYASNGRFPADDDALALDRLDVGDGVESITVEFDSGTIIVSFFPDAVPGGGELWLEPDVGGDGAIVWNCSGSIDARYRPASCR